MEKGEEAQLQKKLDQVIKSNGARCCCRMLKKNVIDSGLDPDAIAGNDDSASISKCLKEVKASLEKQCDYGHLKKNVFKN